MKMYCFSAGHLEEQMCIFFAGAGTEIYKPPIPFYLIQHEKGNVLFDTGVDHRVVTDEKASHYNNGLLNILDVVITEDEYCPNAIQQVGVKPEDIDFIILSHLHHDHAGALREFPNATIILQKSEYNYCRNPNPDYLGYFKDEYDYDLDWYLLNGWQDDKFDLFGDGKIIIYFTPGHTLGHQSVLVNLDNEGPVFLTADACYTDKNLGDMLLAGAVQDGIAYMDSLRRLRLLKKTGVQIFTGHDEEAWKTRKKAPEYYD